MEELEEFRVNNATAERNVIKLNSSGIHNLTSLDGTNLEETLNHSDFSYRKQNDDLDRSHMRRNIYISSTAELMIGLILSCIAGLCEAISLIGLKMIQNDIENVLVLSFWFTLSGTVASSVIMIPLEWTRLAVPEDLENSLYLLGHVGTSSLAMVCYVVAMGKLTSHLMSLFNSAQIPVNIFLQYIFFKHLQPMKCGLMEVIGAIIVTIGLSIHPIMTLIVRPIATSSRVKCCPSSKESESVPLLAK